MLFILLFIEFVAKMSQQTTCLSIFTVIYDKTDINNN